MSATTTISYVGNLVEAREDENKVWFAVEGSAVLSRTVRDTRSIQHHQALRGVRITASIYEVPRVSDDAQQQLLASDANGHHRMSPASPLKMSDYLLFQATQSAGPRASVTSLQPGTHLLCYTQRTVQDDCSVDVGLTEAVQSLGYSTDHIPSISNSWWTMPPPTARSDEQAEWETIKTSCLEALSIAAQRIGSRFASHIIGKAPLQKWARASCKSSEDAICTLAHGDIGGDGEVVWYHHSPGSMKDMNHSLADDVLLSKVQNKDPQYSSLHLKNNGGDEVEITGRAHRLLPNGILSGYHLRTDMQDDEIVNAAGIKVDVAESGKDNLEIIDLGRAHQDCGAWRGKVVSEDLPGNGLHRKVRIKIDAAYVSDESERQDMHRVEEARGKHTDWCELSVTQHLSEGAYIDVDEAQARHDYRLSDVHPERNRVLVRSFKDQPIDVELPASVSGQHAIRFDFWAKAETSSESRQIHAELTLPLHLRYPDPACEQREQCEEYTWVQVSGPLVSIRCPEMAEGRYLPLVPSIPPQGTVLRVPRGILWHRPFVVGSTIAVAIIGTLVILQGIIAVRRRMKASHAKQL